MAWWDHLDKVGGGLMGAAFVSAVGYLISSNTGTPAPGANKHAPVPGPAVWPYALCGAMFLIGFFIFGAAHGMLPWQRYRALKRHAEMAERERDEARLELEGAQHAAIPANPEPLVDDRAPFGEARQVRGCVWQSAKASGGSTVIQVGGDATMDELPLSPSWRTGADSGAAGAGS